MAILNVEIRNILTFSVAFGNMLKNLSVKIEKGKINMKVAIMTDSNSGIMPNEAKELGIFVVPMPVIIDGEEYYENENITQEMFYEKLKQNAQQ